MDIPILTDIQNCNERYVADISDRRKDGKLDGRIEGTTTEWQQSYSHPPTDDEGLKASHIATSHKLCQKVLKLHKKCRTDIRPKLNLMKTDILSIGVQANQNHKNHR